MKSLKEWYQSSELAKLPGMPNDPSNVTRKAKNMDWRMQKVKGKKGVSFEYHISSFPMETKAALGYSEISEDKVSEVAATYIHIKNDIIKIPQYNVKASAGGGLVVTDENIIGQISVGKDWIYKQGLANLNLALIEVSGDSMEPTLSSGDLAMISLIKPSCTDTVEGIHIFSIDGEVRIKRLTRDLSKRGYHLRSDNQLYGNDYIEESELHRMNIIGKLQKVLKGVK